MILQTGDIFCVSDTRLLSRAILSAERIQAPDRDADYSHAGIIAGCGGKTLEALWTVKYAHLARYLGKQIIIARPTHTQYTHDQLTLGQKTSAFLDVANEHGGDWYPVHRLLLHLCPLSRAVGVGSFVVCSELVAKYLKLLGARTWPYIGVNPDMLADEVVNWRNYEIVFRSMAMRVEDLVGLTDGAWSTV